MRYETRLYKTHVGFKIEDEDKVKRIKLNKQKKTKLHRSAKSD